LLTFSVIGIIILVAIVLYKKNKEPQLLSTTTNRFEDEQNALNNFNKSHNFLAKQYPKALILEYIELLMDRFQAIGGDIESIVRMESINLIPYYVAMINIIKASNLDNEHLDGYRKKFSSTIQKHKSNMDFVAIYSLVGLELIGKLSDDAKKEGVPAIGRLLDSEFKSLLVFKIY
jgi:hypothetical protein